MKQENTALISIDFQEKLVPNMYNCNELISNVKKILTAIDLLKMPIFISEQYPKGLGKTIPELDVENAKHFEKESFSLIQNGNPAETNFTIDLLSPFENIIVIGIEAHICVQQTIEDIMSLAQNKKIIVPIDCISSRKEIDKDTAIKCFNQHGVKITTLESVLFALIRSKNHPNFKEISKIIK